MRSIAYALAAIAAAAILPGAAFAQDTHASGKKPPTEARADPAALAKTRATAMKDAPALLQQAGVTCSLTNAATEGTGKTDVGGKKVNTKFYEVACSDAPGYIILATDGSPAKAYDCLAMNQAAASGQAGLKCQLPENADPAKTLQPLVAKTGLRCTIAQARWAGSSPADKFDQYEVACNEGNAYIIVAPQAGSTRTLAALDCARVDLSGQTECTYFPKAKAIQSIAQLASAANRPACQVSDVRYMGENTTHDVYYELACTDQKSGYVLQVGADNRYKNAIECARASGVGGGCTLTSVDMAETAETGTYTKAAQAIGFPCNVQKYHSIGVDSATNREVVEMVCTGRQDAVVAFLPVDKGQQGEVWNCARAAARSLKCTLAPMTATYAAMSQQATAKGKSCQVSNTHSVGSNDKGSDFVEAACTGGPGVMFEYGAGIESVKSVMSCAEAKGIGGGCKLGK